MSIMVNGKLKIGSYDTAKQAAKAFDVEAIKLRRPLASLNYPKKAPVRYTPKQKAFRSINTVGYRGISKNRNQFKAQIGIGGKNTYIGTYDTAKEAAIAFDRALLKSNKFTSLLNFPDMIHNLDIEPKRKKNKRSSTGYRGVDKISRRVFRARIGTNGKTSTIGYFETAIQAALAYDQAAINAGRKKSTLNFPDGLPITEKEKESAKDGVVELLIEYEYV